MARWRTTLRGAADIPAQKAMDKEIRRFHKYVDTTAMLDDAL
jgi:hypothetical protein